LSRVPLRVLQWNCRGAWDKITDLQRLALDYQVMCLQESILYPTSIVSIPGFRTVRFDITRPGLRGLCTLIRSDYGFSVVDLSGISHPTVEILGVSLSCSLDSPVLIFNMYRHPNSQTPSSFFRKLFSYISSFKYAILLGDFNAHHYTWDNGKQDRSGEYIYRNFESTNLVLLNDGSCTHISPPGISNSTIDLSFATCDLAPLCEFLVSSDSHGSDHLPIDILINKTASSVKQFHYKLKLNRKQLTALHCLLERESSRFEEEIFLSSSLLNPLDRYDLFCSILTDTISAVTSVRVPGSGKRGTDRIPTPAPWWNSKCTDAVDSRRVLCRIYKSDPTLDNWIAFRRETARCRRVLKREKRLGWRQLCTSFNSKTPTAAIWRFVRAYKKKSLARGIPSLDDGAEIELQDSIINRLCPPSCFHSPSQSFEEMKTTDQSSDSSFLWMDNPFSISELETAIASSRRNSAPGLDRIDYAIIRFFPSYVLFILLRIFNEIFDSGLFPHVWRRSLVTFVPKANDKGLRPISLMPCLFKIFERMIYRRLQWTAESHFIFPEIQAGFRSSRSCIDNLTTLTNNIHLAFTSKAPLIAVFLDIAGAFDNVIPSILIHDLRTLGFPARICKFVDNLLGERYIQFVRNGELSEPRTAHKGTPQGSVLSPLLFNIYLREVSKHLHSDTSILQYADDIVLFAWNRDINLARQSISSSLTLIHQYLRLRGLELSPLKSKCVIFNRRRGPPMSVEGIFVNGLEVPQVGSARFLGVVLDCGLNGIEHTNRLIKKGNSVANIITSLTGTKWGAHPQLLLSLYRSIFRSSIEYGAQIFNLNKNRSLFLKLQRQQYRIIRAALGLRQSTPINVLLSEAREPPLNIRFSYLTSKYIFKSLARKSNPVTRSLRYLKAEASTQSRKVYLIKNVPSFRPYLYHTCDKGTIHRSILPPVFGYDFFATIPTPPYISLELSSTGNRKRNFSCSVAEVRQKFEEFVSPLTEQAISLYTDGSKGGDDSPVGAAVFSRDLGIILKHKLPASTSIFSAEAWALYQSLIMVESSGKPKAVIFSDSRSVLDAVSSFSMKSCDNYLIPLLRSKFHSLTASGFSIQLVWIPSHTGITGNEMADSAAKRAAINGRKPKFKIPHTDLYSSIKSSMEHGFRSSLEDAFRVKGIHYFSYFYQFSPKPWFYRYSLSRGQIVTINRIRSNHYNLNYSLFRKDMVNSCACSCGDSRQDVNHVIFYCRLTRYKSKRLLSFLLQQDASQPFNIFPFIKSPSHKLSRLLFAFFQAINVYI